LDSAKENLVYFVEGLALNGLVKGYAKKKCRGGKAEVEVITTSGDRLSTGCIDERAASKIVALIALYSKWLGVKSEMG